MALLVLDEQLASPRLVRALTDRGIEVKTVADYGATGRADPDVIRRIDEQTEGDWVFVTMDLTIIEDFRGFDWDRYALAWIQIQDELRGAPVEHAKADIIQRHAHSIREQARGDHHTYAATRHFKHPPSLTTMLRRRGAR